MQIRILKRERGLFRRAEDLYDFNERVNSVCSSLNVKEIIPITTAESGYLTCICVVYEKN